MTQHLHGSRSFKGGAWDLRKVDRRKEQVAIAFPERRAVDRRASVVGDDVRVDSTLTWIEPSYRDE